MGEEKGTSASADHSPSKEQLLAAQTKLSVDERIALALMEGAPGTRVDVSETETKIRRQILYIIALDAEARVRQALAETLAKNPAAPHDIVLALANDVDLVALPILQMSEILAPEDLHAIIERKPSTSKLAAIANRKSVPASICMALIEQSHENVARQLLENAGADIPDLGFHKILDQHGDLEGIQSSLIGRSFLPATVVERAVNLISAEMIDRLFNHHRIPAATAERLALETRERATVGLACGLTENAMSQLIEQILSEGRLTPSLILRSLCVGNLDLVMHVIAQNSSQSLDYVSRRFLEGSAKEVMALWSAGILPPNLLPLALAARKVILESRRDIAKSGVKQHRNRIMQRLVTCSDEMDIAFSDEDIAYLLESSSPPLEVDDFVRRARSDASLA